MRTGGFLEETPGAYLKIAPMVRIPAKAPMKAENHWTRAGGSL
jgi:hypothetical protein